MRDGNYILLTFSFSKTAHASTKGIFIDSINLDFYKYLLIKFKEFYRIKNLVVYIGQLENIHICAYREQVQF